MKIRCNNISIRFKDHDKILLETGKKDEGSVFTDQDFAMLSQLNFANSSKAYIVDGFTGRIKE